MDEITADRNRPDRKPSEALLLSADDDTEVDEAEKTAAEMIAYIFGFSAMAVVGCSLLAVLVMSAAWLIIGLYKVMF